MNKFEILEEREKAFKKAEEIAVHILEECEKQKLPLSVVKVLPEAIKNKFETSETLKSFDVSYFYYRPEQ